MPVVVTPAIARAAGPAASCPLHVENSVITAKIVATTPYFPSIDGDAVIADLPTWLTAANTAEPGVATASELWLDTRPPAGLPLDVASQRARVHELTSDPLARGAISLLLVTALVGLALAAVGLLLTVVGDLREERGSLRDLEAQGATPADLRRHVLLRAAVVGVLGLVGGIGRGCDRRRARRRSRHGDRRRRERVAAARARVRRRAHRRRARARSSVTSAVAATATARRLR